MDLTSTFEDLAARWRLHCKRVVYSSNMNDRLIDSSFLGLIALGDEAVPLMMARLTADNDGCPWEYVLQEVTGVQFLDADQFDLARARLLRLEWWESQVGRAATDHVFS